MGNDTNPGIECTYCRLCCRVISGLFIVSLHTNPDWSINRKGCSTSCFGWLKWNLVSALNGSMFILVAWNFQPSFYRGCGWNTYTPTNKENVLVKSSFSRVRRSFLPSKFVSCSQLSLHKKRKSAVKFVKPPSLWTPNKEGMFAFESSSSSMDFFASDPMRRFCGVNFPTCRVTTKFHHEEHSTLHPWELSIDFEDFTPDFGLLGTWWLEVIAFIIHVTGLKKPTWMVVLSWWNHGTIPETNSSPLKMDAWNTNSFPFGFRPIFRGVCC